MGKFQTIITLDHALRSYDHLEVNHHRTLYHYGECVGELLDDINRQLTRLLESNTRLTCRNVLIANYDTMTKPHYWLNSLLFQDLPRETSQKLQKKIEEMVHLMEALVLNVIQVDGDYADRFFKRIMNSYQKKRVSDYCMWKTQLPELTLDLLEEYQAQLTAELLIMGILKYDRTPSDNELTEVRLDLLKKRLAHDKQFPEGFEAECAKLRRYSHWDRRMFIIDYHLIRPYLFKVFGRLTKNQHIALFEFDYQMKEIHEDMMRLMAEEPAGDKEEKTVDDRVKATIEIMKEEEVIEHLYDYSWIMGIMNETKELPSFDSPQSFLTYLESLDITPLPSESSIKKEFGKMLNKFPNWTFLNKDKTETNRRINVAKRFLSSYRNRCFSR